MRNIIYGFIMILSAFVLICLVSCGGGSEECNHTYTDAVVAQASCTTHGEILHTCSKCGDSYTTNIPALGHNFVDGVCTVCGAKEE